MITKTKTLKCLRCGECCQAKTIYSQCDEEEKNFVEMIIKPYYKSQGMDFETAKCPNLEYRLGLAVCKIYENRPWFCREHFCKKAGGE